LLRWRDSDHLVRSGSGDPSHPQPRLEHPSRRRSAGSKRARRSVWCPATRDTAVSGRLIPPT